MNPAEPPPKYEEAKGYPEGGYPPAGAAPYPPETTSYPPPAGPAVAAYPPPAGPGAYPPPAGPPVGTYPPPGQQPPPPAPGQYIPPPPPGYHQQNHSTVIIQQPHMGPIPGSSCRYNQSPALIVCQHCQATVTTDREYQSGLLTWLIAGGICIIGCFYGCCLIPFCIDATKDVEHKCPNCNREVGKFKHIR